MNSGFLPRRAPDGHLGVVVLDQSSPCVSGCRCARREIFRPFVTRKRKKEALLGTAVGSDAIPKFKDRLAPGLAGAQVARSRPSGNVRDFQLAWFRKRAPFQRRSVPRCFLLARCHELRDQSANYRGTSNLCTHLQLPTTQFVESSLFSNVSIERAFEKQSFQKCSV